MDNFQYLRSFDLKILNTQFYRLGIEQNISRYITLWRQVNKMKFGCSIPRKKLCLDLVISGIVAGVWVSSNEAIRAISDYWEWLDETETISPLTQVIQDFIASESASFVNLGIEPDLTPKIAKRGVIGFPGAESSL
ncbi:hypothetical protein [Microseira sp. BLCC-F43]|uniref:hypothetical protein n=1 Tax=Microseira sp. BLCC-F43 TaxID=3153602 RepID=UPI0035B82164